MKLNRTKLVKLYKAFSCPDWTSRISKYLTSSSLESDDFEVEISKMDIKYFINQGTEDQKSFVKKMGIVVEDGLTISSYEDACKILEIKPSKTPSVEDKIKTIVRATNFTDNDYKEWKPNFKKISGYKYLPYFIDNGFGFGFSGSASFGIYSCTPVGFFFKEKSSAERVAKTYISLYKEWIEEEE